MRSSKGLTLGNLSDRVINYLLEYTRRQHLRSGEELPSEGSLSSELKVSRGVVREAYRSLKTAGVLDIANGRTPRVGLLSNHAVIQFLRHALHTQQASTAEMLDLRSAVEIRAAELAAANRSDSNAEALRREAATMRASSNQRRRFINADIRFHEVLGRAAGNPLFSLLGGALRESLDVTIRAGFDSRRSRAELDRVAQIHIDIADAVAGRHVVKARRTMQLHFKEAMAFVVEQPSTVGETRRTPR